MSAGGDQRWNVREWARLHGIAVAAAGSLEYEEAQWHEHAYINQTWGVEGGVALNLHGDPAGFASGGDTFQHFPSNSRCDLLCVYTIKR